MFLLSSYFFGHFHSKSVILLNKNHRSSYFDPLLFQFQNLYRRLDHFTSVILYVPKFELVILKTIRMKTVRISLKDLFFTPLENSEL